MYEYSYKTNPITSPSDVDSEEQDWQLGEELEEAGSEPSDCEKYPNSSFDSTLLATLGRVWGRGGWSLCVALQLVDTAMTATFDFGPPSPRSLQQTWGKKRKNDWLPGRVQNCCQSLLQMLVILYHLLWPQCCKAFLFKVISKVYHSDFYQVKHRSWTHVKDEIISLFI